MLSTVIIGVVSFLIGLFISRVGVLGAIIDSLFRKFSRKSNEEEFNLSDHLLNYPLRPMTSWGNLGYWQDTDSFVQANRQLAMRLAKTAQIETAKRILDLGFGSGDQLILWKELNHHAEIEGLNPSKSQFCFAQEKMKQSHFADKIKLFNQPAESLSKLEGVYDRVISLDAAYHFRLREDVIRDAFDKLMPGGILCFADIISTKRDKSIPQPISILLEQAGLPLENLIDSSTLEKQLTDMGFADFEIEDISEQVFQPMATFLDQWIEHWRSDLNPLTLLRYRATRLMLRWAAEKRSLSFVVYRAIKQ